MSKLQRLPNGVYMLSLPRKIVEGMGWKQQDEIAATIGGANKLILSKTQSQESEPDIQSEKGTVIP